MQLYIASLTRRLPVDQDRDEWSRTHSHTAEKKQSTFWQIYYIWPVLSLNYITESRNRRNIIVVFYIREMFLSLRSLLCVHASWWLFSSLQLPLSTILLIAFHVSHSLLGLVLFIFDWRLLGIKSSPFQSICSRTMQKPSNHLLRFFVLVLSQTTHFAECFDT